eukprot:TRINITY_DN7869_c0_g1_i9.p1 TRINITY_DN7869_c0_g1~~TRINITY_DN7869_c0_g1_i9.p1  ORF type:complete len:1585 (+),score=495.24 TRINITY_DN7869_c0_g1_i9:174-4928(+)
MAVRLAAMLAMSVVALCSAEEEPVVLLPQMSQAVLHSDRRVRLGSSPDMMHRRNQCRRILGLWREGHAHFAEYKHAQAMFDKAIAHSGLDPSSFDDLEALQRGVARVKRRWETSPAGSVFDGASRSCEQDASVSYKVFLPQQEDVAGKEERERQRECQETTRGMEDSLNQLLMLVRSSIHRTNEDHHAAAETIRLLEMERNGKRSLQVVDEALGRAKESQGKLERTVEELGSRARAMEDAVERRDLEELSVFVGEQVEWARREVERLRNQRSLARDRSLRATERRERVEAAVGRRNKLNATIASRLSGTQAQLSAVQRLGVSKEQLARSGALVRQMQTLRLEAWAQFDLDERDRIDQEHEIEKSQLATAEEGARVSVDKAVESLSVFQSAERSMRTEASLLVSDQERALAYSRLSKLTTKVHKARELLDRGVQKRIQLQDEMAQLEARQHKHKGRLWNQTRVSEASIRALDLLGEALHQNESQYGALESRQALKILGRKRDRLATQARAQMGLQLREEVRGLLAGMDVMMLVPGVSLVVQRAEEAVRGFVCSDESREQLGQLIGSARVELEPLLTRFHSSRVEAVVGRLKALKTVSKAEELARALRIKAGQRAERLHHTQHRFDTAPSQSKKNRMIRMLSVQRQRLSAARLALRRAEAKVLQIEQGQATRELERQVGSSCQVPKHLAAWNQCCKTTITAWRWRQPGFAAAANSKQLAAAAEQLGGPEETALLSARIPELQQGWNASGVGRALAAMETECAKNHTIPREDLVQAQRRVALAEQHLEEARAAELAAVQEHNATRVDAAAASESLRKAKEAVAEDSNATSAATPASRAVKQWKFMVASARRKERSLRNALEVITGKRIAAEHAASDAAKQLVAAQGAARWLDKAEKLKQELSQHLRSAPVGNKRAALTRQLHELDDQIFTVEKAKKAANLGEAGSKWKVSRAGLVRTYVAQYQADRTMAAISAIIPELNAMADGSFENKIEHDKIAQKVEELQGDLENLQDMKVEAQETGGHLEAEAKASARSGVSTRQIMMSTHRLLQQRARYMYEVLNSTGQTVEDEQSRAEAEAKLGHIDDELARIEEMQRKLVPDAIPATVQISRDTLVGEGDEIDAPTRSKFQRKVRTASVKAAQMVNKLEQQLWQLKHAAAAAKTELQKTRAARDMQDTELRLEEAQLIQTQIRGHENVLDRAAKDDALVTKGTALQRELTGLKHQLVLSAMFMRGRSTRGEKTPNTTATLGDQPLQLNSMARMLALRKARDAKREANRLSTLLLAVEHALAAVPSSAKLRVAARAAFSKSSAMKKILQAQVAALRAKSEPADSAAAQARKQHLAQLQRQLDKQTKLAQVAQTAIESSERGLDGQASGEHKNRGGCSALEDVEGRESCSRLVEQAVSRCSVLHYRIYDECCGSVVQAWRWGRDKYQAVQAAQLELEQSPPWLKTGTPAEMRNVLKKMQKQRKAGEQAARDWATSLERRASDTALHVCKSDAEGHRGRMGALGVIAETKHTLHDADEPLSVMTLEAVPAGTSDGATDMSVEIKQQLHSSVSGSMSDLDEQLQELEEHHRSCLLYTSPSPRDS